jgi:hypothetical protein
MPVCSGYYSQIIATVSSNPSYHYWAYEVYPGMGAHRSHSVGKSNKIYYKHRKTDIKTACDNEILSIL